MSQVITLSELGELIAAKKSQQVLDWSVSLGELTIVTDVTGLLPLLSYLHDNAKCRFHQLTDLCGVDYPAREQRFEVVYHLLSTANNRRIRVKLRTDENTPVPTAVNLYPAAGWYEREVWDMYGVYFSGNPDLRRILTDYGFDGHPLRKDFPLTGHVEVRYDAQAQRVVYEPVKLQQEFRSFDYPSPWEGVGEYVLPGDEKAKAS
jgi:NADH-quinone oxidoreductase subunit C